MKQQVNHSTSKAYATAKDLNTFIEEEISNNEFQKTTVKTMISRKKHKS
jgi:hypothetical protein